MADRTPRLPKAKRVELNFLEAVRARRPEDDVVLKALGDFYTKLGFHEKGLGVDEELARLCPGESEVWYNLGCSYALVGRKDDAFSALSRAVRLGYQDLDWMSKDADLESLKKDPRFKRLLEQAKS